MLLDYDPMRTCRPGPEGIIEAEIERWIQDQVCHLIDNCMLRSRYPFRFRYLTEIVRSGDLDRAWEIPLLLLQKAPYEALGHIAAGPLEDFVDIYGDRALIERSGPATGIRVCNLR